jgi:hypothetical protein
LKDDMLGRLSGAGLAFFALLLVGCELNPRGELPGADQGGPAKEGDFAGPDLPFPPAARPEGEPLPFPEVPFPGFGQDEGSASSPPIAPPDTTRPTIEPDGESAEEAPIYGTDAGAGYPLDDAGAQWPGGSDAGSPAYADAGIADNTGDDDNTGNTTLDTDEATGEGTNLPIPADQDSGADGGRADGGMAFDGGAPINDGGLGAHDGGAPDGGDASFTTDAGESGDAGNDASATAL